MSDGRVAQEVTQAMRDEADRARHQDGYEAGKDAINDMLRGSTGTQEPRTTTDTGGQPVDAGGHGLGLDQGQRGERPHADDEVNVFDAWRRERGLI